jgi:UDP:flavonoid glycosyltransferase YjiC (YdhE family)
VPAAADAVRRVLADPAYRGAAQRLHNAYAAVDTATRVAGLLEGLAGTRAAVPAS